MSARFPTTVHLSMTELARHGGDTGPHRDGWGLAYLEGGDACVFERAPLERLAKEGQLKAWRHEDFWQCMDTYREQQLLERLWQSGQAPWKVW